MTRTRDGVRVAASIHAAEQGLKRVPVLRGADRAGATRWIERSTAKALNEGRTAKTLPIWCVRRSGFPRKKATARGVYRFAWNEERTAVFMVVKSHEKDGGGWVVMTVMAPPTGDRKIYAA